MRHTAHYAGRRVMPKSASHHSKIPGNPRHSLFTVRHNPDTPPPAQFRARRSNYVGKNLFSISNRLGAEGWPLALWLGHQSIETTPIYYAQTPDMCSKAI